MSPARAISSRSPSAVLDACSQAAFRRSVQLTFDLVAVGRRENLCSLVGTRSRLGSIDAAGGDVGPVPGPLAERGEGTAYQPWLPRHLNNRIPIAIGHSVVRPGIASIGGDQYRAVRDVAALAPRKAGHCVPPAHLLPSQFPPEPGGATEHQDLHNRQSSAPGTAIARWFAHSAGFPTTPGFLLAARLRRERNNPARLRGRI